MRVVDVVLTAKAAAQSAYAENRTTPNYKDYAVFFREIKDVPPMRPRVSKYVAALYERAFAVEIKRFGGA